MRRLQTSGQVTQAPKEMPWSRHPNSMNSESFIADYGMANEAAAETEMMLEISLLSRDWVKTSMVGKWC